MAPQEKLKYLTEEKERVENMIHQQGESAILAQELKEVISDLKKCQEEITKSEKLLKDAMKEGKVSVKITNALIQGEAGVGKTSTKCILFDEPPPQVRTSTPLAEAPVQVQVDNSTTGLSTKQVSDFKARSFGSSWRACSNEQLQGIVAEAVAVISTEETTVFASQENGSKNIMRSDSVLATEDEIMQIAEHSVKKTKGKEDSISSPFVSTIKDHSCSTTRTETMTETKDGFTELAKRAVHSNKTHRITKEKNAEDTSTNQSLTEHDKEATSSRGIEIAIASIHSKIVNLADKKRSNSFESSVGNNLGTNWIYFIDSGGQPHFHNLLPHFVHSISVALFVHRLSGKLEDHIIVEYYEDGQSVSTPYESTLTTEDTLKCLVRSMQSHTIDGEKPKLVFIGTFHDKIRKSSESLSTKNKKLLNLLKSEFRDQLVFCSKDFNDLIFPLNAKNPGNHEKKIAELIRIAVELSPSRNLDIPIWWYVLEITLKELSSAQGRKVFSKQECLKVAHQLKLSNDALDEALKFFHRQHIFSYYPDILPNVVFTSSQVLLDKLTELIRKAYEMRRNLPSSSDQTRDPTSGCWLKFRDEGIITLKFIESFKQHYRIEDKLFAPPDLLKIFMKHFILTPLTTPELHQMVDFTSTSIEYYMPSLLGMLSLAELENHRVFSFSAFPLLIHFPNGWPRAGVFCCLQVYLIQQLKYRLVLCEEKPRLIAQNCVMLSFPGSTCIMTLIDSFSYFEVHMKAKANVCHEICPIVLKDILSGIDASCRTLRYNNDRPHLAFFCPCDRTPTSASMASGSVGAPPQRHAAELIKREDSLRCTVDETVTFDMEDRHTIWYLKSKSSLTRRASSDPTLEGLLQRSGLTYKDIDQECSDEHVLEIYPNLEKWERVAMHLRVKVVDIETIKQKASHDPELMRLYALQKWKSIGAIRKCPSNYRELLKALLKCGLNELALEVCELLKSPYQEDM